jgi:CDP-glycerol glycerophosphotransferase (TagB/SpsB family)
VTCWSEIQREELVDGDDWHPDQVMIGGIPSYDGYFNGDWLMGRDEYFALHGLDPRRKLISYASSFITFSPNIQNVEALARLVDEEKLAEPSQLLVRLHPNHFMDVPRFAEERQRIFKMAAEMPHVHVVEPVALGGELGYYSGEDMPEKASMMAYSDVFVTVYSTMVVETATLGRPVVSACIDSAVGWPHHFTLPLSKIGGWPTHERFRVAGAGRVALDEITLEAHINYYLQKPDADREERAAFIQDECTYVDGSAGRRTAENILKMLENGKFVRP